MSDPGKLPTDEEIRAAAETLHTFLCVSVFEQYAILERYEIHPQLLNEYLEDLQKRFDRRET